MAEHKKRIVKNFISLSIVQGLSILFPLIIFPYLLRVLGVEGFGVFTLIQAVIMYVDLLVTFGFGLTATKAIAKNISNETNTHHIISSVFFIKIILFAIPAVLFLTGVIFIPFLRDNFSFILISGLYVIGNMLFPDWYFQGIQKMRTITVVTFISKCISFVLIISFVKNKTDIGYAISAMAIGNFIAGLFGFIMLMRTVSLKIKPAPKRFIMAFFKESGYVFSSLILVPLYSTVNLFILQFFTNPLMVGYYAISEKIFNAISMITSVANRTFYPYLSQLYRTSLMNFKNNVYKITMLFLIAFSIFAVLQFGFAGLIVSVLSGNHDIKDISYAVDILKIMSIAVLFSPFGSYFFQLLIIQGRKKTAVKNIFSVVIINLFSASTLAYLYGGKGMAINLCMIVFFIALFNFISYHKKVPGNKIL
ncbi:MAG: oligosaccharide flippase family protein [Bacteroidota bacterium]